MKNKRQGQACSSCEVECKMKYIVVEPNMKKGIGAPRRFDDSSYGVTIE